MYQISTSKAATYNATEYTPNTDTIIRCEDNQNFLNTNKRARKSCFRQGRNGSKPLPSIPRALAALPRAKHKYQEDEEDEEEQ
jgi:hypothetical protein